MDAVTSGLNTEIFSAEREWTVEGLPVLTAQVSLPEPAGSENRTTRRIRRYYRAQCRAFLRYCDRWLFPMAAQACREAQAASRPLLQLQAELSYRVTYNEGGFWSLYTQIREPAADGHILLRRWGDTWDLRRGYPVSLPSFFPHRRGWKRRLLTLAAQEIQRQETAGYARYLDGWRRRLRQQFNPLRFYLTRPGGGGYPCLNRPLRRGGALRARFRSRAVLVCSADITNSVPASAGTLFIILLFA